MKLVERSLGKLRHVLEVEHVDDPTLKRRFIYDTKTARNDKQREADGVKDDDGMPVFRTKVYAVRGR